MELDELKSEWNSLNMRLNEVSLSTIQLGKALRKSRLTSLKSRLLAQPIVDLGGNIIAAMILGGLMVREWGHPTTFVPVLLLHICVIGLIATAIGQIVRISEMSALQPVVQLLAQLAQIKKLRLKTLRAILFAAPLLWAPLMTVSVRALLGIDLCQTAPSYVAATYGFGLCFLFGAVWVSHWFGPKLSRNRLLSTLVDTFAGQDIVRAESELAELQILLAE
jgi:hypothetical protein